MLVRYAPREMVWASLHVNQYHARVLHSWEQGSCGRHTYTPRASLDSPETHGGARQQPRMGIQENSCVDAPLGIEVGKVGDFGHPVAIGFADVAHVCAQLHEQRRRGLRPVVDQRLRTHNPKVITCGNWMIYMNISLAGGGKQSD